MLAHSLADDFADGQAGDWRLGTGPEDDLPLSAQFPQLGAIRIVDFFVRVNSTWPPVLSPLRRRMVRPVVVLPQPDSPTRPMVQPRRRLKVMPSIKP